MTRGATLSTLVLAACAAPGDGPRNLATARWELLDSGVEASLRGLSPVDGDVCWASGSAGTVLRTLDGGRTWESLQVAGAEELDFRDVQAFDASRALVLSAGQPARIYGTTDGGRRWMLLHDSPHEEAFFDSFAFFDERRGIAFSDPVGGTFLVLSTGDGGATWRQVPAHDLPAPVRGEAGFAASGTCVAVCAPDRAWIGTGGGAARVLRSVDGGASWSAHAVPLVAGEPSQGVFSVGFATARDGVAVGGDYHRPQAGGRVAAWTDDGGVTWRAPRIPPSGYRSCVAAVPGRPGVWVAVGLTGTDWSDDGGRTWRPFQDATDDWHAIAFGRDGAGWAVGAGGRVGRLRP